MGKMLRQPLTIVGILVLFGMLLVGCRPAGTATPAVTSTLPPGPVEEPSPTKGAVVNLAAELTLENAVGIEVLYTDPGAGELEYQHLARIDDPEVVQRLVETLDQELALISRVRCPTLYLLRFEYDDGSSVELGYGCNRDDPSRLRGDQDFWVNPIKGVISDVEAPDAFCDLLAPYLEGDAELSEELLSVRDRTLSWLRRVYPAQAPGEGLTWSSKRMTPEGVVGAEAYRFEAKNWSIEIRYPVGAPEKVVYTIEVANDATGFRWKGEVAADGGLKTLEQEPGDQAVKINPVTALALDETVSLELSVAGHIMTIKDADEVAALIEALDTELPLIPRAGGSANYSLHFVQQDGESVTLYVVGLSRPVRLRGDQAVWQGRDVEVPEAFQDLMIDYYPQPLGADEIEGSR